MRTVLAVFFLCLSMSLNAQGISETLEEFIKQNQKEHQIPAIAVSLVTPDSIFSFTNGKVRVNQKERIAPDAKFHLGSNSKAITAFIAMHLTEQGIINFETSFFELFPELETTSQKAYSAITLGDLLSHNAQIPAYTKGSELVKFKDLSGTTSEKRYAFAKTVLSEKPVKTGTYSNAGYVIAALMLEKASGKSYKMLLDEVMNDLDLSYFIGFPNKESEKFPWGHLDQNGSLTSLAPDHDYKLNSFMASAGDISMNIEDYSKFIQLNLQGLTGQDNYLEAAKYQQLHFGKPNYAYGWGNIEKENQKMSYHDGSAGTYYCHTVLFPEKKIAVIIMANTATQEAVSAIYEIQKWISDTPNNAKK